jgi:2-polyprenyl-6-methoxyphenol hydroxylase-like FAD-dependent oxidoreductase
VRALIVGGGIGGLATAIALRKLGIDCKVLEQSEAPLKPGTGLSLWSNAVIALRELGLEEKVVEAGSLLEKAFTMTESGRVLSRLDVGLIGAGVGAVSVCLEREKLRRILTGALPWDVIRLSARCVSFAIRGDTVIAHMSDGSTTTGDLLIGADGLHSPVRAQLLGPEEPRYAGYTCWRGLADGDLLAGGAAIFMVGSGSQGGVLPCGKDRVYWFATRNTSPKADFEIAKFADSFPPPLRRAIQLTPSTEILRHDIFDRPPVSLWGKGPVTLLGDAAHPTTPTLGQGACQALEDAVILAKCLALPGTVSEALRSYERLRQPRTAMVTNDSWSIGQVLQTESPILLVLRDLVTASPVGAFIARRIFRRLLSFNPASFTE